LAIIRLGGRRDGVGEITHGNPARGRIPADRVGPQPRRFYYAAYSRLPARHRLVAGECGLMLYVTVYR